MSDERDPRLFAALGEVLGALGESALAELLTASEHGRRALLKQDRFATLDLSTRLLARCRAAWLVGEAEEAIELAKLATLVAERVGTDTAPERDIAAVRDLSARHLAISARFAKAPITPLVTRRGELSWVAEGRDRSASRARIEQAYAEVAAAVRGASVGPTSEFETKLNAEIARELRGLPFVGETDEHGGS